MRSALHGSGASDKAQTCMEVRRFENYMMTHRQEDCDPSLGKVFLPFCLDSGGGRAGGLWHRGEGGRVWAEGVEESRAVRSRAGLEDL